MTNLIVNGDAESGGPGSPDGSDVSLPGWKITAPDPSPTRVLYGAIDPSDLPFPTLNDPIPTDPGTSFFAGGSDRQLSAATQEISLADHVDAITAGTATFTLEGWLGGFGNQEDWTYVGIQFVTTGDPADAVTHQLERVDAAARDSKTGFVFRTVSGPIPKGDRPDPYANLVIEFRRESGLYNDGYLDNLSLRVS